MIIFDSAFRKQSKHKSKFEEQYFFLNIVKNRFQKTRHAQLHFSQRTSNISEKWPFPQKSLQRENHLQLLTDTYVNGIFRCFSTPLGHIIVHISSTFPAKQNRLWQQFCMPYTLKSIFTARKLDLIWKDFCDAPSTS